MNRAIICSLFFYFMPLFMIYGQQTTQAPLSYEKLLAGIDQRAVDQLNETGLTLRYDYAKKGNLLAPNHPAADKIKALYHNTDRNVLSEILYLMPYPDDEKRIILRLYNATRSVSGLTEARYPSAKQKKQVMLMQKAYRVTSRKDIKPLDDPLVTEIPERDEFTVLLKDNAFGTNFYKMNYHYDGQTLGFGLVNLNTIRVFIKAINAGDLAIALLIFPTDKGYLIYGYTDIKLVNAKLVFQLMDPFSAFYKRLLSIIIWLDNSINGTEKVPVVGKELDF